MTEKILAFLMSDKPMKNGSRRLYIDVDKTKVPALFQHIGIPEGDSDGIPVWLSSAEHPEDNIKRPDDEQS